MRIDEGARCGIEFRGAAMDAPRRTCFFVRSVEQRCAKPPCHFLIGLSHPRKHRRFVRPRPVAGVSTRRRIHFGLRAHILWGTQSLELEQSAHYTLCIGRIVTPSNVEAWAGGGPICSTGVPAIAPRMFRISKVSLTRLVLICLMREPDARRHIEPASS
jgi:hypothetical protein